MLGLDIIAYARNTLDDNVEPYKWKNSELALYLNDAGDEAARRSYCLICYPSLISITGTSNISFVAATKTISKPTGGFLYSGGQSEVNTFEIDDQITISGTVSNDGIKTISSVVDTQIKVLESLVDESNVSSKIEATRTMTRIPLKAGVHTYKLHPQTLMVIRARPDSLSYPLRQKTVWSLDSDITVVDYDLGSANYELDSMWYYDSWETLQGNTYSFLEENGFIRIISPPQIDDILWLVVARLPKIRFTDSNLNLSPEIPTQYHQDLADWIVHRAYLKQDVETQDMIKAKWFGDSFDKKFGPRPTAQTEMNRRRHPPNQRMRARQFGFG